MPLTTRALLALALGAVCGATFAQNAQNTQSAPVWPTKPVRIVVGFAAGTPPDIFARLYGDHLAKKLNVPFVIDNKPGTAGNLASDTVAKAPGDGHTLLYNLSTAFTINPFIYSKLPFDPEKDLVPVASTMRQGLVLIGSPKAPGSVKELVAAAKAKPGTVTHASYGAGSPSHLIVEWFKDETRTEMVHVPYRTSPVSDVMGGAVDLVMEPIATGHALITSQRVKALAYSGPQRHPSLPDVPTLAETVPGLDMTSWHGIWAPGATPPAVLTRINALFVEASKAPEVQSKIRELQSEPLGLSRGEMAALLKRDAEIYSRIVKAKNIKVD